MDRAEVRPMEGRDRIQVEELERSCFSQPWSDKLLMETLESRFDTCFCLLYTSLIWMTWMH